MKQIFSKIKIISVAEYKQSFIKPICAKILIASSGDSRAFSNASFKGSVKDIFDKNDKFTLFTVKIFKTLL